MAVFVGTNRADNLSGDYFSNATNYFYGLRGDDQMYGGRGIDRFYAGPGADRLAGSHGVDYYHYVASFQSIYIDEFESSLSNGPTNNYSDRLVLYTTAGPGLDPENRMKDENFGLEFVQDAFFVMPGQTADSPFGTSLIETDVLIYTDTGVIHIYDQYGGENTAQNTQTTDGIEFILYKWTNYFGATTERSFQISDEFDVFTGTQNGSGSSEFFFGTRGPDTINGNGGDDLIFTGAGDDTVFGGSGTDHIVASAGTNLLNGGNSGDVYYWNAAYTARNIVREDQNSSNDELVANFSVADLGAARLVEALSTQDGPVLTLELEYRDPTSSSQVRGSFEIERQIDPTTSSRGIEYLRFDGKWFVTQDEFSPDGVGTPTSNHNANDFIVAAPDFSGRMRGFAGDDAIFGGSARDRLVGGPGDDLLVGNGGPDRLFGGPGDDILRGGPGGDLLNGGGGSDTADYRFTAQDLRINLATGAAQGGPANGDVLRSIENVTGGAGDDALIGDGGANVLEGREGDDVLRGRGGEDVLRGGAGADRMDGGGGGDRLFGGAGNDRGWGSAGNDRLYGEGGADRLWGGAGADRLWGGAGNDRLAGDAGRDRLWGDGGNDVIFGGGGGDWLYGGGGRDKLYGGLGGDRLGGGRGNDVIEGGRGNDLLWGGGGRDRFVFNRRSDDDQVRDFTPGADVLDFSAVASGFADLTLTDTNRGLLIEHAGGSVLLRGVTEAELRVQDVAF